ncbi:fatty acid desaturase-domain-containing protein [Dactylonectria macrodidyma]|uniref:Delta 8-(E)-sphingolipid desaturase n=1 Tax=Dactylonectria macrodidyma TaxID=307937 RepID=A0A9P9FSL9_9HYPO|nr:fatty acid desaturase-domain-containing protein [Dactylonectria macrodidyma]
MAAPRPHITGFPALPPDATKRTPLLITRDEIEALIAEGRQIFILHDQVIKADGWMKYHPGGDKAIRHMVGKDASDEVDAYHSMETRQQMLRYRIGRIEGSWVNFVPPFQGGVFRTRAEIEADSHDIQASDVSHSPASSINEKTDAQNIRDRAARKNNDSAHDGSAKNPEVPLDGMSYLDTITHEYTTLDLEKYPSPDQATQAKIVAKYRALHERIFDEGLYECKYSSYGIECCRYSTFVLLMGVCFYFKWYYGAAFWLGVLWHQLGFVVHDASHIAITHSYQIDSIIAILVADFLGGLSAGWWKWSHNVHHIVTNAPEHDPDIEHLPIFAVSHRLLANLRSTYYDRVMKYDAAAKVLLRIQAWTYYPILSLARFNLFFLSLDYLIAGRGPKKGPAAWHRWLEMCGQVFFWTWFGYGLLYKMLPDNQTRLIFMLISNVVASPLHLQIVLSHFAMSTMDLGPDESFAQRMLRTTMDIDCPEWLDFFHGGLQFQVIHHLFPRVPRHNLRTTQKLVQEFCNEVGIPYALYGFAGGNKKVIGRLAEVSRQAAILAKCQKSIVENGNWSGVNVH